MDKRVDGGDEKGADERCRCQLLQIIRTLVGVGEEAAGCPGREVCMYVRQDGVRFNRDSC